MVDKNASPSLNPTKNDYLAGTFGHVLNKFLQGLNDMLPARVIAVASDRSSVNVQPLIMVVDTNGNAHARPQIAKVPVVQIGGGGFILNFPIKPGDIGFIKANDRDISLFMKTQDMTEPNTSRFHAFEDAVFIPAVLANYTIAGEDADNVVLQTLNGACRIAVATDHVKITGNLIVHGDINATGDITAGTISLKTHIHSGVQPGGGNTGAPV